MFANLSAIETLVTSDSKATDEEKESVLSAIRREGMSLNSSAQVLSIADAARFIGKPRKSVYHLLRNGTLKGFYSGKEHKRATGITRQSLEDALAHEKGTGR